MLEGEGFFVRMRKEYGWALAVSLLLAAALLLVFSRSSPLYPTNSWAQSNAFFTVGRGMLAGKVPYRDLAYDAGPVIYALHALAACISPMDFLGVWLLEIVALAVFFLIAWKTAVQICKRPVLSMGMVALLGLLITSSEAFAYGDTVEEFALPLQMWAIYDLVRYMGDPERRMSSRRLVMHGFLAGCVLWMKYSLAGIHIALIAVIAVDAMVREWEMRGAIWMCLDFAAGGIFATVPWVTYLGLNGALKEFYDLYVGRDWNYFTETFTPLRSTVLGLASSVLNNPVMALVILCGAGFLLRRLVHRKWNAMHTAILASFVCAAVLSYMEGVRIRYTHMVAGPFAMLCAGPLVMLLCRAWRQRRIYGAGLVCCAIMCAGYSWYMKQGLSYIGYPEEELTQVKFAKYIEEQGGGTMLTYRIEDCGFYLAAGQMPECREFAKVQDYDDGQYRLVDEGLVEWVVSTSKHEPSGLYIQVQSDTSGFDDTSAYGTGRTYYLYRLIKK